MTWLAPLPLGFSRIGFIEGSGSSPHASACATCARPISPPTRHGYELFDMFCALNGATDTPLPRSHAQIAVAIQLLPEFDEVPPMKSGRAFMYARAFHPGVPVASSSRLDCGRGVPPATPGDSWRTTPSAAADRFGSNSRVAGR